MDSLLEEKLGYKFRNGELLAEALTHSVDTSSVLTVQKHTCDRLKTIGDCVIKLVTCQYAISVSPPHAKVGTVSKIKDDLCNRQRQNQIGVGLDVSKHVVFNPKSLEAQPCISVANDTYVKSLMGAVFVDAGGSHKKGFVSVWKLFLKLWKPFLEAYEPVKPLIACFPQPVYSSREYLKDKHKDVKFRDLHELEDRIGFVFSKKPYLLEQALTHDAISSSPGFFSEESGGGGFAHYQCLEFLGDSVLELIVMEYLYSKYTPADPLGQMLFFNRETGQRLYSSKFQVKVAKKLELDQFVIKQPGVAVTSYDDFVESVIGAVYVHSGLVGLKKTAAIVLNLWELQPIAELPDTQVTAEPGPPLKDASPSKEDALVNELQQKLGYRFKDVRILNGALAGTEMDATTSTSSSSSSSSSQYFQNLEVVGERVAKLEIAEYVIGICPAAPNANPSAKIKKSMETLWDLLSSSNIRNEIAVNFGLKRFVRDGKSGRPEYGNYVSSVIGAVYVDSGGDYAVVSTLFNGLWGNYLKAQPKKHITHCFHSTSEQQQKLRTGFNAKISEEMWSKLHKRLGHTFRNRNLLEQALTDEKSQGFAKAVLTACPTGNPFGLALAGKCAVELFISLRGFQNTASSPENFGRVLERLDQSLLKVLQNNLRDLGRYYAKHGKFPFPPSKKPRAPYDALFGAVYVDAGAGVLGLGAIEKVVAKQDPSLLNIRCGRASASPPNISSTLPDNTLLVKLPATPPQTPVSAQRVTPVELLNTSLNSKCAANFSISPDRIKQNTTTTAATTPSATTATTPKLAKTPGSGQKNNNIIGKKTVVGDEPGKDNTSLGLTPQIKVEEQGENKTKRRRRNKKKKKDNNNKSLSGSTTSLSSAASTLSKKRVITPTNKQELPELFSRVALPHPSNGMGQKSGNVTLARGSYHADNSNLPHFSGKVVARTEVDDMQQQQQRLRSEDVGFQVVPINMVHGYPNQSFRANNNNNNKGSRRRRDGSNEEKQHSKEEQGESDGSSPHQASSSSSSVFGVVKWTAIVLGVLFLINRYNRK